MRQKRKQSGFGVVEVMVAAGIVGVIMAGIVSLSTITFRQQSQAVLAAQMQATKSNLVTMLNTQASWLKTLELAANQGPANAPNLNCLRFGTPCTTNGLDKPNGSALIDKKIAQVADASGAVYYNNLPTTGFTSQGAPCNTFVAPPAAGNDACPIHYDITWTAICGASCIAPQPRISVTAIYNPARNRNLVNTANYSQIFIQGAAGGDCWKLEGGFLTANCGNVGIGTTTPPALLTVVASNSATASAIRVVNDNKNDFADDIGITSYSNTTTPSYASARARGNQSSPLPVQNSDWLGDFTTFGWNGSAWVSGGQAGFKAENNWSTSVATNNGFFVVETAASGMAPVERLRVSSGGNVGIGTTSPQQRLDVNGNVRAQSFLNTSDRRMKTNIGSLNGNELVRQLRGVRFRWSDSGVEDIGLIAQEVELVAPELVVTDGRGFKSVKYGNVVAILIENAKKQDKEIVELRRAVEQLSAKFERAENSGAGH